MEDTTAPLTDLLQQIRKAKRISQLELALSVGVSQRHVSFVESGRAKPSRDLLLAWLERLSTPLAVRNAALLKAGYAPVFSDAALSDSRMVQPHAALLHLLKAHEPMPAMVIGARWELLHMNQGAKWLAGVLMPWASGHLGGPTLNMLDLLIHPEGFTKLLVNLDEVGPAFLAQLRDEVAIYPELKARTEAFAALLKSRSQRKDLQRFPWTPDAVVLPLRFATAFGELSFFKMFSTFGCPQDITLASLRVEHLFPADSTTECVLREYVPGSVAPGGQLHQTP